MLPGDEDVDAEMTSQDGFTAPDVGTDQLRMLRSGSDRFDATARLLNHGLERRAAFGTAKFERLTQRPGKRTVTDCAVLILVGGFLFGCMLALLSHFMKTEAFRRDGAIYPDSLE